MSSVNNPNNPNEPNERDTKQLDLFQEVYNNYSTLVENANIELYDKELSNEKINNQVGQLTDDFGRNINQVLQHPFVHRILAVKEYPENKDFVFQIFDINSGDECGWEGGSKFHIHLFGLTSQGQSVHVNVRNYKPFFYVKAPSYFTQSHANFLLRKLQGNMRFIDPDRDGEIISAKLVNRKEFFGFTNEKKFKYICIKFKNLNAMRTTKKWFYKSIADRNLGPEPIKFMLYESNIEPHIRFIHLSKINPCGWVKLTKDNFEHLSDLSSPSTCQYDFSVSWENVEPYEDGHTEETIAPVIQASFDIECVSGSGAFPEAENLDDKVIQIGTTIYIRGRDNENEVLRHIITLNSSDDIDGAYVESYNNEKNVLLAWARFINIIDPDVIIGYNINGFDFKYLHDRAILFGDGIERKFSKIGRYRNRSCQFKTKELASSALGDNKLYFYELVGRVNIDVLKYVQREFKFEMYNLNSVASEFFNEKVSAVEYNADERKLTIFTKITPIIKEGNYVSFMVNDFLHGYEDTHKFQIAHIDERQNTFIIENTDDIGLPSVTTNIIKWCLVKDDVPPNKIFEYQNIDAHHRGLIAKYCIQDCILCNKLMDKLDIVSNSVGMANICFVPVSYLFMRGQGVKIYSLVAKQCRLEGYLIKEQMKDFSAKQSGEEEKYKGATVLSAVAGAYFVPLVCNDFASLYPSSMISHNISPDMFVKPNNQYDNLNHVDYHNIEWQEEQIKNSYRFALPVNLNISEEEKDVLKSTDEGKKQLNEMEKNRKRRGIIPRILIRLLEARKAVKKRMKSEADPFKKSILNGLQLAYKITCNSMYGQFGATTSPICMKEIAACTTAVGRQLLEFSKDTAIAHFPGSRCIYGDSVVGDTPLILRKGNKITSPIFTSRIDAVIDMEYKWRQYTYDKEYVDLSKSEIYVWNDNGFTHIKKIIRHLCVKNIVRVITDNGIVDCTEDHSLVKADQSTLSPIQAEVGDELLHSEFPAYLLLNGTSLEFDDLLNDTKKFNKMILNGKELTMEIMLILMKNGYSVSVIPNDKNHSLFTLDYVKMPYSTPHRCFSNKILKIISLGQINDYVYDLETENHHFHVGPGNLIVHNTDSAFINYATDIKLSDNPTPDEKAALIKDAMDKGMQVEKIVSELLPWPHNFEYEKTYYPYILLTKKRYIGPLFEFDPYKFKYIDKKGIVLKRRDNAKIVKYIYQNAINIILFNQDVNRAKNYVRDTVREMFSDKFDINMFVITKTYKITKTTPAHVHLAQKIAARDPGNAPQLNDRIPYAYVKISEREQRVLRSKYQIEDMVARKARTMRKKLKQEDQIEHPDYIAKNNLKIDYCFYLTNQIQKPLGELFSVFIETRPEWKDFDDKKISEIKKKLAEQELFRDLILEQEQRDNGQLQIFSFLNRN